MNGAVQRVEYERWHALYCWLAAGCRTVEVPFAPTLADAIPEAALATHMRRAFPLVLACTSAIALLHRANREERGGRIVAAVDDYATVRKLADDLLAASAEQAVPDTVRETVEAVETLSKRAHFDEPRRLSARAEPARAPSVTAVARKLGLDKSTASRRVEVAEHLGYLRNGEERDGKPARLFVAAPLPDGNAGVLPEPARLDRCTVAPLQGKTPRRTSPRKRNQKR